MAGSGSCATRSSPRADPREGHPSAAPGRAISARICRDADPAAGGGRGARQSLGVSMPEVLVRRGTYAWMPPLPTIPGIELSGTVVEQGRGVTEPAVGSPVFVSAHDLPVRAGCYAEYIGVPAAAAHLLPPGCELEAAACLSNYQVAYHLLHSAARGATAECVLIHTAAGGVGSAAVQLACRMVDASEVAFVAVFLASEKAGAVSGELLSASGGAGRSVYY